MPQTNLYLTVRFASMVSQFGYRKVDREVSRHSVEVVVLSLNSNTIYEEVIQQLFSGGVGSSQLPTHGGLNLVDSK